MKVVRVPKERVAVLIGKKGNVKKRIENSTGAKLYIDSESGDIEIDDTQLVDPLYNLKLPDLIKAVGRGFSPNKALRLLDEGVFLTIIDIKDYSTRPSRIRELKGRLIGRKGKTRELIETLTTANLSIYGHTVAIIGTGPELEIAGEAVRLILQGSKHGSVYTMLERRSKELRMMHKLDYIESI